MWVARRPRATSSSGLRPPAQVPEPSPGLSKAGRVAAGGGAQAGGRLVEDDCSSAAQPVGAKINADRWRSRAIAPPTKHQGLAMHLRGLVAAARRTVLAILDEDAALVIERLAGTRPPPAQPGRLRPAAAVSRRCWPAPAPWWTVMEYLADTAYTVTSRGPCAAARRIRDRSGAARRSAGSGSPPSPIRSVGLTVCVASGLLAPFSRPASAGRAAHLLSRCRVGDCRFPAERAGPPDVRSVKDSGAEGRRETLENEQAANSFRMLKVCRSHRTRRLSPLPNTEMRGGEPPRTGAGAEACCGRRARADRSARV